MSDLIPEDAHPIASSTSKPSLTIPGLTSTPIPHATATPPLDPTSSCTYTTSRNKLMYTQNHVLLQTFMYPQYTR
ncbi:MAG: hypothetical protein Q9176_007754 [Flavoplaca citrina]